jgi:deazaflavin-dependent oxidoreductase (nitroreductase family)
MTTQKPIVQRSIERFGGSRVGAWIILNLFAPVDTWLLTVSKGRIGSTRVGYPTLLLTTIGAKTGQQRTVPLIYIPHGEKLFLVASNGGEPKNPGWYYNLCANPLVQVTRDGTVASYLAREVEPDERAAIWAKALSIYTGFEAYRKRTTRAQIPIIELQPQSPSASRAARA